MEGGERGVEISRVLDLVFPRFCLRCGQEGTAWCSPCAMAFSPLPAEARCAFCHAPGASTCADCRPETFLDGLTSVVPYGNAIVREALTNWKYHADPEMGKAIDLWIRQSVGSRDFPGTLVPRDATVTFLPLHASRRRHRGFDQAEEVAKSLASVLGTRHRPLLERTVATASQAKRSAAERAVGDLDGIFEATGPVPESVILCDDVCTSGATIDAAAEALKKAGAKRVWGFVVAQGG